MKYEMTQPIQLRLDPRTKMLAAIIITFIMIGSDDVGFMKYVRIGLACVPFALCLISRYWRLAFIYVVAYAATSILASLFLSATTGFLSFVLVMLIGSISRLLPALIMGNYLIKTTTVSEFIASMERMHMPNGITIPLSIMFRFLPTIREEYRSIGNAMKMRGIKSAGNPLMMLEYRLVPLLMSVVNIGDELSVSAVTRGLGGPAQRTSLCTIGFGWADVILAVSLLSALAAYIIHALVK